MLVATIVLVALAAVWAVGVFGGLVGGGFEDPRAESSRAERLADDRLGRDGADVLVVYRSGDLSVDSAAFRHAVTTTIGALPPGAVRHAVDYYATGARELVSTDRRATVVKLTLRGDDHRERLEALEGIRPRLRAPGLETLVGGPAAVDQEVKRLAASDLRRAELWSVPVLLVLLVLIFGGVAAACPPLAVGAITVVAAAAVLRGFSEITQVSVYAVNVASLLGLGLAIDYGLFVVTRFREELHRPGEAAIEGAVARTMASAGRTVAVSGLIITLSLAGLLIFPQPFLRSIGLGGIAATLLAVAASLTVLPALLAVLGFRIGPRPPRPPATPRRRRSARGPFWSRVATAVMRRPVLYAAGVGALLIVLGLPFLRVQFGITDHRVLPSGAESHRAGQAIHHRFPGVLAQPVQALVTLARPLPDSRVTAATGSAPTPPTALDRYVRALGGVPGVSGAQVTGAAGRTVRISVRHTAPTVSAEARHLVHRIRAVPPPPGAHVAVGGRSAEFTDLLDGLGARLPWMALTVAAVTFLVLLAAFGSVVLPLKALLMNVLSLGASFGALVWIFQDGHLSGLLDFTPTGSLDATMPILVLAVVFGVSMDYEVFLLSRVREHHDATGDTTAAVAAGLQHTGRIITGAALLLIVVCVAFAWSHITLIKLIGVALVVAVAIDALVVRTLLVPATMRLLGAANWWAPPPLRRRPPGATGTASVARSPRSREAAPEGG
ncbi:membrane protein [Actinomadura cremea]|nr:membrane protein [Actinomadura cremea]